MTGNEVVIIMIQKVIHGILVEVVMITQINYILIDIEKNMDLLELNHGKILMLAHLGLTIMTYLGYIVKIDILGKMMLGLNNK